MKNILVPTDFSDCSVEALKTAAQLAKKNDATIHLLHMYERPAASMSWQLRLDNDQLKKHKQLVREELKKVEKASFLKGLKVKKHLAVGDQLWEEVTRNNFKNIDLMVMGTNGKSSNSFWFIGSNTNKSIRVAKFPVLVVKNRIGLSSIKNIVFASNFDTDSIHGFEKIKAFTETFRAKLHLLKVITPINFEKSSYTYRIMDNFVTKQSLKNYTVNIYNSVSLEEGILEFIASVEADMIVLETYKRSGISRALIGSTVEDIVVNSEIPVLTTPTE